MPYRRCAIAGAANAGRKLMTSPLAVEEPRALRHPLVVRTRRTLEGDGAERVALSVFCPTVRGSVAVSECLRCAACHGVSVANGSPSEVLCREVSDATVDPTNAPSVLREALHRVIAPECVCIRSSAPRRTAVDELSAARRDALVVVDGDDRPLGIVRAADLLSRASIAARAGFDAVGPRNGVPEDSPVVVALGWIAQSGLPLAPVVSADGSLVGTYGGTDLARWFAAREGFVDG
jgi:CBS-domain-containing membrane protein